MSVTPPINVMLRVNKAAFDAALSRLAALAKLAPELVQCVLDTPHLCAEILRVVPGDNPAPGTPDLWIRFEPSEFLLKLMAALEALQGERRGLEDVGHPAPPGTQHPTSEDGQ